MCVRGSHGLWSRRVLSPPPSLPLGQLCLSNFIYWASLQDFVWIKDSASKNTFGEYESSSNALILGPERLRHLCISNSFGAYVLRCLGGGTAFLTLDASPHPAKPPSFLS